MPNLLNVSPDEAMQLGRCPECGQQLMRSTARAHAEDHWGGRIRPPEAQRRYDMLCSFAAGTDADGKPTPPATPNSPSGKSSKIHLELNPIDLLAFPFFLEGTGAILRGEITLALLAYFIGCALIYAIHLYGGEVSSGLKQLGSNPWGIVAIAGVLLAYVTAPRIAIDIQQDRATFATKTFNSDNAATSQIADLQQQLDRANAEIRSLQTRQQQRITPPTSTASGAPIGWNGNFGFAQGTDANGEAIFSAIIFSGTNTSSVPVQLSNAYIVSELTGAQETLQVSMGGPGQLAAIAEINQIPPNALIELWAPLKPALHASDFLAQWGKLRFHAEYGDIKYDKVFDENTVTDYLRRFPSAHIGPHITKKVGSLRPN